MIDIEIIDFRICRIPQEPRRHRFLSHIGFAHCWRWYRADRICGLFRISKAGFNGKIYFCDCFQKVFLRFKPTILASICFTYFLSEVSDGFLCPFHRTWSAKSLKVHRRVRTRLSFRSAPLSFVLSPFGESFGPYLRLGGRCVASLQLILPSPTKLGCFWFTAETLVGCGRTIGRGSYQRLWWRSAPGRWCVWWSVLCPTVCSFIYGTNLGSPYRPIIKLSLP